MSDVKKITHDGTVVAIEGDLLKVEIINVSACSSCSAANLCSASEKEAKVVDVIAGPGESYSVGDIVTFEGDESMGIRAVAVAYVTPLLLVVAGLLIGRAAGLSDAGCALAALAPLVPFYIGLYLLRDRIDKTFKFKTKNL